MPRVIRVRVTPEAGRLAVCIEKDKRHPNGEVAVKRVGTEHVVAETPTIVRALELGYLEIIPEQREEQELEQPDSTELDTVAASSAGSTPIPRGIWKAASLSRVRGATVLSDLPEKTIREIARANGRSKVQREFIKAARQYLAEQE